MKKEIKSLIYSIIAIVWIIGASVILYNYSQFRYEIIGLPSIEKPNPPVCYVCQPNPKPKPVPPWVKPLPKPQPNQS